ncbi:MAG: sigma-70 family RNA polymerase sigma factor [Proteobacteria bacterium]|nr:sigma-70 family RNA polymerase sigma factor [Pseudomonadota bacterium]
MGKASYAFFRYLITDLLDNSVPWEDHAAIIEQVEGKLVPHRKADPEPHDHDTFIMRQRQETIASAPCVIFDVAKKIMLRVEHRYNPATNDLDLTSVKADDTHWTHVVMVPNMGMVAIRDGSGERLTANSGASRIRSILRHSDLSEFEFERTATSQDVMQAVFCYLLTKFPGFRLTAQLRTYLYPVVRSTAATHLRKKKNHAGRKGSSRRIFSTCCSGVRQGAHPRFRRSTGRFRVRALRASGAISGYRNSNTPCSRPGLVHRARLSVPV